ncbi:MAG: glycosyl hydrolase 108 family protein [Pseudomonadota bacterium]
MTNLSTRLVVPKPAGWSRMNDVRYAAVAKAVLAIEGGHSNDRTDRGGETQYGVSLRFLKAVGGIDADGDGVGDLDLNMDTVLDGRDIRLLTPELATDLFQVHFYIGPGFWTLAPPYDAAMFDQAVNGGTTAAIKILQRALNRRLTIKLRVDGQLGPKTTRAFWNVIGGHQRAELLAAIRDEAARRYEAIITADPSQAKYRKGWLRRAQELGRV